MKQLGDRGERIAVRYLKKKGYRILETNYRVHRVGEIDAVAADGETLVFVEVKYRKSSDFGRPEEYVDRTKRTRLIRAAEAYLMKHPGDRPVRFDVVAITGDLGRPEISLIQNAFGSS